MRTCSNRSGWARPRGLCAALAAAGALALSATARADIDWNSADWGGFSPNALSYWSYRDMGDRSARKVLELSNKRSSREKSSKTPAHQPSALSTAGNVAASGAFVDERGIEQLARLYPRDQFQARKKQYTLIVQSFNQSVRKLYGLPSNNLATGMAVVAAGAYSAYHNQRFPDAWVRPLYQQMKELLLQDPRVSQRPAAQKAVDYQVMVGTGMAMMLAQAELEKAPNADTRAQLRRAGAETLRTLFQADPGSVTFTSAGLKAR
ncbi:MAG: hypothetical protein QM772_12080 [Ottowia sp.]|uniref:DUF6683 family protein n=1 Tax=Ottowia sp. TaxID=1898956 RepID=UPI0039E2C454